MDIDLIKENCYRWEKNNWFRIVCECSVQGRLVSIFLSANCWDENDGVYFYACGRRTDQHDSPISEAPNQPSGKTSREWGGEEIDTPSQ